jgi:hypothetical protein
VRRYGKPDSTQAEIVAAAKALGASVAVTTAVGRGFPDLIVGYRGQTLLVEVKSPTGALRPSQMAFRETWRGGPFVVIESANGLLAALASLTGRGIIHTRRPG